jgi:hypothetical protein
MLRFTPNTSDFCLEHTKDYLHFNLYRIFIGPKTNIGFAGLSKRLKASNKAGPPLTLGFLYATIAVYTKGSEEGTGGVPEMYKRYLLPRFKSVKLLQLAEGAGPLVPLRYQTHSLTGADCVTFFLI